MLKDIISDTHPDVTYLLNEKISIVLADALACTYANHPNDPVDFFSRVLLHHIQKQAYQNQQIDSNEEAANLQTLYEAEVAKEKLTQEKIAQEKAKLKEREDRFF